MDAHALNPHYKPWPKWRPITRDEQKRRDAEAFAQAKARFLGWHPETLDDAVRFVAACLERRNLDAESRRLLRRLSRSLPQLPIKALRRNARVVVTTRLSDNETRYCRLDAGGQYLRLAVGRTKDGADTLDYEFDPGFVDWDVQETGDPALWESALVAALDGHSEIEVWIDPYGEIV